MRSSNTADHSFDINAFKALILTGTCVVFVNWTGQPVLAQAKAANPQAQAAGLRDPLPIPPNPGSQELWYRNYAAGDAAQKKGDSTTAKKYYFAALESLEKNGAPKVRDPFFLVRLSALEHDLMAPYPDPEDWEKVDKQKPVEDKEKLIATRQEQVQILKRISDLNQQVVKPTDLLRVRAKERYEMGQSKLNKLKEQAK